MSLDKLTFVRKIPAKPRAGRVAKSPLEKAKDKLLANLQLQISLSNKEKMKKPPRSWVEVIDDTAFITVRHSNKPLHVGGKGGGIITCEVSDVVKSLEIVKNAVEQGDLDTKLKKAINSAKRKPDSKKK